MCFLYLVFHKRSLTDVTPTTAGRDRCCFNLIFLITLVIGYKQPTAVLSFVLSLFDQRDDSGLPIARQIPYFYSICYFAGEG